MPETKGKSVLTDKKLATQVYNPRKMFVTHEMVVWLDKHPAKKNDTHAKTVRDHLAQKVPDATQCNPKTFCDRCNATS